MHERLTEHVFFFYAFLNWSKKNSAIPGAQLSFKHDTSREQKSVGFLGSRVSRC